MKTMFKSFSMLAVAACAGMSITSCNAEKDYFDPSAAGQFAKASYESTFLSEFGAINPGQSWDFATDCLQAFGSTRSFTGFPDQDGFNAMWGSEYKTVNPAMIDNIAGIMIEGTKNKDIKNPSNWDNQDLGETFAWEVPNNTFYIQPIFQGYNALNSEIYMIITYQGVAHEYLMWSRKAEWEFSTSKAEQARKANGPLTHIQIKKTSLDSQWTSTDNDGTTTGKTVATNIGQWSNVNVFEKAAAVQSQTLVIEKGTFPVGASITFRSVAKSSANATPYKYNSTRTNEKDMITLDNVIVPDDMKVKNEDGSVDTGYKYKILSCEAGSDHDLNDAIFLVYGKPEVPHTSVITDGERKSTTSISKRYMIEDLGATQSSDIDFNDLVVDVEELTTKIYKSQEIDGIYDQANEQEDESLRTVKQIATIKALGGTKDITLKIGGVEVFKKSTSGLSVGTMYNTGLATTDDITINLEGTPWIPERNNISVIVGSEVTETQDLNSNPWEISFPVNGSVPTIIAVPTTQTWNDEYISVFAPSSTPGQKMNLKEIAK